MTGQATDEDPARAYFPAARAHGELSSARFAPLRGEYVLCVRTSRLAFFVGGLLIAAGIVSLYASYARFTGWWQGTTQALGVGFVVGGLVDVLAISRLNQLAQTEDRRQQQFNDRLKELMARPYKDGAEAKAAHDAAIEEFLVDNYRLVQSIDDPRLRADLVASGALARMYERLVTLEFPEATT